MSGPSTNTAHDALTLVLRLSCEPDSTHSPETLEVLARWKPALDAVLAGLSRTDAIALVVQSAGPDWRDPKDKPPHLPGEAHSEDVLIWMKDAGWSDDQRLRIGHVSCGNWRPRGGNGNFDDDVLAWMPLPSPPSATSERSG